LVCVDMTRGQRRGGREERRGHEGKERNETEAELDGRRKAPPAVAETRPESIINILRNKVHGVNNLNLGATALLG